MFQNIFLYLCLNASLYLGWDPQILQKNSQSTLHHSSFITLKNKVLASLEGRWCSQEKIHLLMDLTLLTQPKVCVEIGAFNGSSVLPVAATLMHLRHGTIFAIDAWSNLIATQYLVDNDPNKAWWGTIDLNLIHKSFIKLIQQWGLSGYCVEIHQASKNAVQKIPSKIDFLHLDGDYSEIGSLQDVELYLPKVRSGGYILLSNFYSMIHREQPKIKAFCALCEECEIIATIEKDNAVLFKKN